ncbi:MAG TPA: LuxR C-terminal-related transcriptional regulator [Aldersonia sp.]
MGSGWPLTGRAEELQAITECVDTVDAAGIVLAGAAGVGKTRLARETLTRASRRGHVCRFVAATTSAQSVPLGAFAEYADRLGPDPLARIRDVVDAVTCTASRGPVVVGVDDAHLLDAQSALVVHQIVRRHLAMVVLTVRTGEPAPDAITALWKDELVPRMEVQPLSRAETASLLETVLAGDVESATAARVWDYTRGNALYLRQLIADELATGRFLQRAGVWIWDTHLRMSPTLTELIDTTIGRQPDPAIGVLDVLAVADPLELAVLSAITPAQAIDAAEAAGVITVDTSSDPAVARTKHPLIGEVRRARAGTMRLRHLRGRVATELEPLHSPPDPIQLVRRAVLIVGSDTEPDPMLLIDASIAATRLMDPITAERLASRAVEANGGTNAKSTHMLALVNSNRLSDALTVNAELIEAATTDQERVLLTLIRALILLPSGATDAAAEQLELVRGLVAEAGLHRPYSCVLAAVAAFGNRPRAAVDAAIVGFTENGWLGESFDLMGLLAFNVGCGDLGRLSAIREHAERGYDLARTWSATPTTRFVLVLIHIQALRLGGVLDEATELADRLAREPMDFPFALAHRAMCNGITAMARGDLVPAKRWLREALATGSMLESPWLRTGGYLFLATVLAMSGDSDGGRAILREKLHDGGLNTFTQHVAVAEAWLCATRGVTTEALTILADAVAQAERAGCPAREVWCLQTAAQFGDSNGAARLAELSRIVQGPRVTVAAKHAAALHDRDADALRGASAMCEAFGDRIAAADTAAQAAVVYREQGRRGAAMTATAVARRLAGETGADTPALRANTTSVPLTTRQREIISLAATGLSNREIAERLTMSVRTVEGHIFRASQKTGVNSREELIALLESGPAARP